MFQNLPIMASSLMASVMLLAASFILAPASAAQAVDTRTNRATFTVEGNSLDEMQEQVRQQVNDLGLTNEQEEEKIINEVTTKLEKELPSGEARVSFPDCTITITIIYGDPHPCFFDLFTCSDIIDVRTEVKCR
jgi:hypothetical protein